MSLSRDGSGQVAQALLFKRFGGQNVTIDGTARESTAFANGVRNIRLAPDANCYWARGASGGGPITSSNGSYLAAGAVEYISIANGEVIHVIQATGSDSGAMNITEEQV